MIRNKGFLLGFKAVPGIVLGILLGIVSCAEVPITHRHSLHEDEKTANAWVMPGGKAAVYSGILRYTQDETGLAVRCFESRKPNPHTTPGFV